MIRHIRKEPLAHRPGPPSAVGAFIAVVVILSLLTLVPEMSLVDVSWRSLTLFAGLTVLVEVLAVDTSGRGKTSTAVVTVLAAAFLYGTLGVLTTVLALTLTVGVIGRSPLHRMLFNFGMLVLSAQAARASFALFIVSVDRQPLLQLLLPAAAAGLVYYAINHFLLSVVRSLTEHRTAFQIWWTEYRWLWPHYPVFGLLGLGLAVSYRTFGIAGVIVLLVPVTMMHLAIRQYLVHATASARELHNLNQHLADTYEATLEALTRALDMRDEATEAHAQRVRSLTEQIALQLGIPETFRADLLRGALLHDIGKIGVPDAILRKPGALTPEEWRIMRQHPQIGYDIIAQIPFLAPAAVIVLHHHEAYDGSGYPNGLTGSEIPLGARIFAVVDTFDAITSDRPYRRARSVQVALDELQKQRGIQFDPVVVDAFVMLRSKS